MLTPEEKCWNSLLIDAEHGSFRIFDALRLSLFDKPSILTIRVGFSPSGFPEEFGRLGRFFRTQPLLHNVDLQFMKSQSPGQRQAVEERLAYMNAMTSFLPSLSLVKFEDFPSTLFLRGDLHFHDDQASAPYNGPLLHLPPKVGLCETSFLFGPHFLNWTINSINASRVVELTLRGNLQIAEHMERLTLNHLSILSLKFDSYISSRARVTPLQLNRFLSRHPTLTTVNVSSSSVLALRNAAEATDGMSAIARDALPNAHDITLPGEYLASWLSIPSVLPSITHCRVYDEPPESTMQKILYGLARRGKVTHIHLPLFHYIHQSAWMDIPLTERTEPKMKGTTDLSLSLSEGWNTTREIEEKLSSAIALFPDIERVSLIVLAIHTKDFSDFRKLLKKKRPSLISVRNFSETFYVVSFVSASFPPKHSTTHQHSDAEGEISSAS